MYLRSFMLSFVPLLVSRNTLAKGFYIGQTTSNLVRTFKVAMSSSTSSTGVEVSVGSMLPSVTMNELTADSPDGKPQTVVLTELCKGKKVAIFGVPGAFTPGCSKSHLPSFIAAQSDLKAKGIDMTICVATNDAFVMEAWGRTSGGTDAGIRFLSDSAADLSKELGMAMETPNGIRTKRFSLVADDNKVTHFFGSDKESSNTWAPSVLSAL